MMSGARSARRWFHCWWLIDGSSPLLDRKPSEARLGCIDWRDTSVGPAGGRSGVGCPGAISGGSADGGVGRQRAAGGVDHERGCDRSSWEWSPLSDLRDQTGVVPVLLEGGKTIRITSSDRSEPGDHDRRFEGHADSPLAK